MSCEHCAMRDRESGNIVFTEGEPYEHGPYYRAYIEQECNYEGNQVFWLHGEKSGWTDDVETTSIPIMFCPWCGGKLNEVAE